MTHYLLIEFDEAEQRDALRERIDTATEAGKNYRVCGIFCSPGRWCTCARPTGYHKDEIVRGGKFGWWIHIGCRRARMGTHQLTNLLRPQDMKLPNTGITMRVEGLFVAEVVTKNIVRST